MIEKTVTLKTEPNSDSVLIAVGQAGENIASAEDIDVEWDSSGMLTITFADGKEKVPLQCVDGGKWITGDRY